MASVALPEMKRHGYSGALATGALAAGGTLGILIPPSVILVIYAVITEQSIGKLFLAALIPGVISTLGYAVAISAYVRIFPKAGPVVPALPFAERVRSLGAVLPIAAIFLVVLGGIYLGMFTPTEGAAIGAASTALLAIALGRMSWKSFASSILETAQTTAAIFLILIGAEVYNGFLALSQLPAGLSAALASSGLAPMTIMIGILLIYMLLGCVMDSLAMILLTVPVFFPLVTGLEFGPYGAGDRNLVRDPYADRRRDRADHSSDRPQRLRDQFVGRRRLAWRVVPRHLPVPVGRFRPRRHAPGRARDMPLGCRAWSSSQWRCRGHNMRLDESDQRSGGRRNPDAKVPVPISVGLAVQIACLVLPGAVMIPTVVFRAAGQSEDVLLWAVYASVAIAGVTTMLQARRIGWFGSGYILAIGTSGAAIAVSIAALAAGGPALLATMVVVVSLVQFVFSARLSLFRRILTPTVTGTVLMLTPVTVMPVMFAQLQNVPSHTPPLAASLSAAATLVVIAGITLMAKGRVRLWAPVIGMVAGSVVAGVFGFYDVERIVRASWIGIPRPQWSAPDLRFGPEFWTLLPAFVFIAWCARFKPSAAPSRSSACRGPGAVRWTSGRCRAPWPPTGWATCCPVWRARCRSASVRTVRRWSRSPGSARAASASRSERR